MLCDLVELCDVNYRGQKIAHATTSDFEPQFGKPDAMFLSLPPTVPVTLNVTEKSSLAINGATIGVCRLISKNEEIELGIRHYLHDLLSPKFTDEKYTSLDEYFNWANGIKIRILQQPKHGKLRMIDGSATYYVPDQDYLGKDVVEVLASAKDTYGKPISKRVIFFINAQPDYETEVAHDAYMKKYSYYLKKYCGRLSSRWIIPSEQKKSVGMECSGQLILATSL